MQSQTELMESREPRELMERREPRDEVLDVYVEHEVALEVDPTLIQGQGWCHRWETM